MLNTRSSRDFSIGYPTLLSVGFVLWMAYGVALGNLPMMLSNTASLTFMLVTIGVALYFRRIGAEDEPRPDGAPPAQEAGGTAPVEEARRLRAGDVCRPATVAS